MVQLYSNKFEHSSNIRFFTILQPIMVAYSLSIRPCAITSKKGSLNELNNLQNMIKRLCRSSYSIVLLFNTINWYLVFTCSKVLPLGIFRLEAGFAKELI